MSTAYETRRQRQLKLEGATENVLRHWLTGEVYEAPVRELQRRRPYRKGRRNLPTITNDQSGQLSPRTLTIAAGVVYSQYG
jgi:hypothetical protein